jgi:hypothetical protein
MATVCCILYVHDVEQVQGDTSHQSQREYLVNIGLTSRWVACVIASMGGGVHHLRSTVC